MKLLIGLIWALGGAVVGAVVCGLAAMAYAQWTDMTNREGAAGFFMVGMGLLGGLAGLVIGLVLFARGAAPGHGLGQFGQGVLGLAAFGALVAAAVWGWMQMRETPVMVGDAQVQLMLELRLPQPAAPAAPVRDWLSVEVNTADTRAEALLQADRVRLEDGFMVIPALQGPLIRAGNRLVVARLRLPGGARDELFTPLIPRTPGAHTDWSGWTAPGPLYDERGERLAAPAVLGLRWRVRVYGQD